MRKNALIFCLLALLGVLPCLGAETYSPPGLDSVWEQAEEYGHSLTRELAFLTAHSMLHLFGYDHMDEAERAVMERKQEEILENRGYTR